MLRWTPAGLQAIQAAESSGTKIKATHIAIGDGGGQTPDHSGSTMLVNELYRQPIDTIDMVDAPDVPSGKVVEFGVSIPETKPETGSWMIREVAILTGDTVIGIGPHPELEKVGKDSPKGTMTHTITAPMVVSNEAVISLAIAPSVHATMGALSDHNKDRQAHQDIREASTTAISEHNRNDGAHGDIRQAHQTAVDEIAVQKEALETLEKKVVNTGVRQAVISYGLGITTKEVITKTNSIQAYNTGGASDATLNFGVNSEHGLFIIGQPPARGDMLFVDTMNGLDHYTVSSDDIRRQYVVSTKFFNNIINNVADLGTNAWINAQAGNIMMAFTTPCVWREEIPMRSFTIDCISNHGHVSSMAIRSIEFLDKHGNTIPIDSDDYTVYATTEAFLASNAFAQRNTKDGHYDQGWVAASTKNQRLGIVFKTIKMVAGYRINNGHHFGGSTDLGVSKSKPRFWTVPLTPTQAKTFDYATSEAKLLGTLYSPIHNSVDGADDQDFMFNEWWYNPGSKYAMTKYYGYARGVSRDIKHPMGMPAAFLLSKKGSHDRNWLVQAGLLGNKIASLNTNTAFVTASDATWNRQVCDEHELHLGTGDESNWEYCDYTVYAWFGEQEDSPNGAVMKSSSVYTILLNGGGTFDCGFIPKAILGKQANTEGVWSILLGDAGWNRRGYLNEPVATNDLGSATPVVDGTKVTFPKQWSGLHLFVVFGEEGYMPEGKSIQIKASPKSPFVASISDGFDKRRGWKDKIVGYESNQIFHQTMPDGEHDIILLTDGSIDLIAKNSFSPDIKTWKNTKVLLGSCTIVNGLIIDIDLIATGHQYETPWFPVSANSKYRLPNLFKTGNISVEIFWKRNLEDTYKRRLHRDRFLSSNNSVGAEATIMPDVIEIDSFSYTELTGYTDGYYKLRVKRGY